MLLFLFVAAQFVSSSVCAATFYGCNWEPMKDVRTHSFFKSTVTLFDLDSQATCFQHGTVLKLSKISDGVVAEIVCLDGKWYPEVSSSPEELPPATNVTCQRPAVGVKSEMDLFSPIDAGETWDFVGSEVNNFGDQVILDQMCTNGVTRRIICLGSIGTWAPQTCSDLSENALESIYWPLPPQKTCSVRPDAGNTASPIVMSSTSTSSAAGSRFFKIKGVFSWDDAQTLCRYRGGQLASIRSPDDQVAIDSLIADSSPEAFGYWTAGRTNGSREPYIWSSDNSSLTYTNWKNEEPNWCGWLCSPPFCIRVDHMGKWDDTNCIGIVNTMEGALCEYLNATDDYKPTEPTDLSTQPLTSTTTSELIRSGSVVLVLDSGPAPEEEIPLATPEVTTLPPTSSITTTPEEATTSSEAITTEGTTSSEPITTTQPTTVPTTLVSETTVSTTQRRSTPITTKFFKTTPKPTTSTTKFEPPRPKATVKPNVETLQQLIPLLEVQRERGFDNTSEVLRKCDHFEATRLAPPLLRPDRPLSISIGFEATSLIGISNVDETIALKAVVLLSWAIETCPWESSNAISDRASEQVQVALVQNIWLPHIRFLTAADGNVYMKGVPVGEDFLVTMETQQRNENRTFTFYWTLEGAFRADCSLELGKFPFDHQSCTYEFALQRNVNLIQFNKSNVNFVFSSDSVQHTEWEFVSKSHSVGTQRFNGYQVSTVRFMMDLQRIPTYYIQNLVVPCGVLALIDVATFLMPPQMPDRPAFAATIVLALTVAQTEVMNHVPKKPTQNWLSRYVQLVTWLTAATAMYQLFALWLQHSVYTKNHPQPIFTLFGRSIVLMRALDAIAFIIALLALIIIICVFFINIV